MVKCSFKKKVDMMDKEERVFLDRRKGPDFLVKWVKWAGTILWVIAIAIIMLADKARPPVENFFDRHFDIQLRKSWDTDAMLYAFYLLIILFITCLVTIFINSRRHRRKTDKYNPSIIILTLLSLAGIIFYLLYF